MLLNNFFSKSRKRNVSLNSVIGKFKFSREAVVLILRHAGFEIIDTPYAVLNEMHLEILSQSYVESVKGYFANFSKNFYNYSINEQNEFKAFYSRFIKSSFWENQYFEIPSDEVLRSSKLDGEKIKDFFFKKIQEIEISELFEGFTFENGTYYGSYRYNSSYSSFVNDAEGSSLSFNSIFNKIAYKLKLKVKRVFTLSKEIYNTILVNCHYHIFIDDEEENSEANLKNSFSIEKYCNGEALKIINFLKLNKPWLNTSNLLKT